jgi:O-antigen/teichoic acid export membrane protein
VHPFSTIHHIIENIEPIQRQSLISGGVTLIITIFGFFSTIYFAHTVGASILGIYFLFLAYFGLFNLVGEGGFAGAAIKRISEGKDQKQFLSAFLTIRVLLMLISIMILVVIHPFLTNFQDSGLLFLTMIALFFGVFSDWAIAGVYGSGKIGLSQISILLNNSIRLSLQIFAIILGFGIYGLLGGFIFGMICGIIFNLFYLDFQFALFKMSHIKSLFSFAIWSFLSSGGLLIFSYADSLLIGYFLNTSDVAIYRTAFNLTAISSFTVLAFQYVLFPKISNWWTNGSVGSIKSAITLSIHYSLALAIPFCVGGWILGDRLLYFLYGSSFSSGYISLFILLFVQIINVFMVMFTTTLNALNHPSDTFKVTIITAPLAIFLEILLIPVFGINGAAAAILIAFLLNVILTRHILSTIIKIPLKLKQLDKIILSTIIMGFVLLLYRWLIPLTNVIFALFAVIIGCVVYFLILLTIDRNMSHQVWGLLLQLGLAPRKEKF